MGCTGNKTYEEEVSQIIKRYIQNLGLSPAQEKELKFYIQQDLTKKALALQRYKYIYRDDDVNKTVEEYKNYIIDRYHLQGKEINNYKPDENNKEEKESENDDKKSKDDKEDKENKENKDDNSSSSKNKKKKKKKKKSDK